MLAKTAFSQIARSLESFAGNGRGSDTAELKLTAKEQALVERIAWMLPRVARQQVFKTACLGQAIAARRMLQRRGISSVLHIGVNKESRDTLQAHAWLEAGGIDVTGGSTASNYTEISRFT